MRDWLNAGVNWASFRQAEVVHVIPELRSTWLERVTIADLWEHTSGLAATRPCFDPPRRAPFPTERRETLWLPVLRTVTTEPAAGPRGETIYSDLGVLLLGLYLERGHQRSLEDQWNDWKKAHGVDVAKLTFGVKPDEGTRFDLTEPTETRHPKGEVNDDKAASLGGRAPHAGLFGTCGEVWSWLEAVQRWRAGEPRLKDWLEPPTEYYDGGPKGRFHGGWDRPTNSAESQGGYPSPIRAIGHLGFTGTAMWWDPATSRAGILLTNRVYPEHTAESQVAMKKIRQEFFSRLWRT